MHFVGFFFFSRGFAKRKQSVVSGQTTGMHFIDHPHLFHMSAKAVTVFNANQNNLPARTFHVEIAHLLKQYYSPFLGANFVYN